MDTDDYRQWFLENAQDLRVHAARVGASDPGGVCQAAFIHVLEWIAVGRPLAGGRDGANWFTRRVIYNLAMTGHRAGKRDERLRARLAARLVAAGEADSEPDLDADADLIRDLGECRSLFRDAVSVMTGERCLALLCRLREGDELPGPVALHSPSAATLSRGMDDLSHLGMLHGPLFRSVPRSDLARVLDDVLTERLEALDQEARNHSPAPVGPQPASR